MRRGAQNVLISLNDRRPMTNIFLATRVLFTVVENPLRALVWDDSRDAY